MPRPKQTAPTIACCLCGRSVPVDATVEGRCINCLSATTDFTEKIERNLEVEMCRTCGVWYRNPQWVRLQPESPELLALCVRRVKDLKGMRLVDASWIWTEPHSRRLKVKLTVAAEVLSGTLLQRSLVVEFVVKTRNCDSCNKAAAKDTWQAKVQLRQRCEHPRTLLAMEQASRLSRHRSDPAAHPARRLSPSLRPRRSARVRLGSAHRRPSQAISAHGMARDVVQIKRSRDGLDLTFHKAQHAQRFVAAVRRGLTSSSTTTITTTTSTSSSSGGVGGGGSGSGSSSSPRAASGRRRGEGAARDLRRLRGRAQAHSARSR